MLWCVATPTQKLSSGKKRGTSRGTEQATPAATLYPLTETRQAPKTPRNCRNNLAGIHRPTSIVCWAALCGVDCPSVRAAKAVSLCLASTTSPGGTRHTSLRRRDLVACPTNHRRLPLSNLNLIGLNLLLVKAVIGPPLSKMSIRIGTVPGVPGTRYPYTGTTLCITPPWSGVSSSIARQPRGSQYRTIRFRKALGETFVMPTSFGTGTIPTAVEISTVEIRPRGV